MTLVGADPNSRSELILETMVETVLTPSSITQSGDPLYGCDDPQLTPEERANCGIHNYSIKREFEWTGSLNSGDCSGEANINEFQLRIAISKGIMTIFFHGTEDEGGMSNRIAPNTYQFENGVQTYTTIFSQNGFTRTVVTRLEGFYAQDDREGTCTYYESFTLID